MIATDGTENQIAFAADDVNDRLAVTIAGLAAKTIETRVIVTGGVPHAVTCVAKREARNVKGRSWPKIRLTEWHGNSLEGLSASQWPIKLSIGSQRREGYNFGPAATCGIGCLGMSVKPQSPCHSLFVDLLVSFLDIGHAIIEAAIKARAHQARQEPKCHPHDPHQNDDIPGAGAEIKAQLAQRQANRVESRRHCGYNDGTPNISQHDRRLQACLASLDAGSLRTRHPSPTTGLRSYFTTSGRWPIFT